MIQLSWVAHEQLVNLDRARHWNFLIFVQEDLNVDKIVFYVQWDQCHYGATVITHGNRSALVALIVNSQWFRYSNILDVPKK